MTKVVGNTAIARGLIKGISPIFDNTAQPFGCEGATDRASHPERSAS
jgi:hypothetical protein